MIAAFVYFDVSFMVWMLLGALGAYVAADLDLSAAEKGLVVAVPPLGGAVFRLVFGGLGDGLGVHRVGLWGLGMTVVPLAWGAVGGGSLWQVLGIGLLLGVAGASFAVALPLVSRWYPPQHQGLALGVVGAANSGTLVAVLAAPRLAERVTWHGVFALAILPVAVAFALLAAAAKEPPRRGTPSRPLVVARQADARWLAGMYAVSFGGFVGLSAYLPIFFVDRFGLAKVTAATVAAGCAGTGSLLRPVGGLLADRLGGLRVLSAVFGTGAAAAAGVAAGPNLELTAAAVVVFLAALGVGNGAVFQLVPQRFPVDVGSVTGLVGAAGGLGGFVVPLALGLLHQATGSFAPGFLTCGAVAVAARVAVSGRRERRSADWKLEVAT